MIGIFISIWQSIGGGGGGPPPPPIGHLLQASGFSILQTDGSLILIT